MDIFIAILYRRGRPTYVPTLLELFLPGPARTSEDADIASFILEFIRIADRANGLFGKDQLVSFAKHHPLGHAGADTSLGRLCLYFEPEAPPFAPDFRFEFSEDHEGTIKFSVSGAYRYRASV